jgi:tRNA 2-thiocytidine biosynthesis protein TtcA
VISNNAKKLQAQLRGLVGKAIADYSMIEAGDRVMAVPAAQRANPF